MNLKFMKVWPEKMDHLSGTPTKFKEKIFESFFQCGVLHKALSFPKFSQVHLPVEYLIKTHKPKRHTIRKGCRWKKGDKIHFQEWEGKPYKSKCIQFAPIVECVSVQKIEIIWYEYPPDFKPIIAVYIDDAGTNGHLSRTDIEILAINDGFESVEDFIKYFNSNFEGQIIHWTDLSY